MTSTVKATLIWSIGAVVVIGMIIGLAKLGAQNNTLKNVNAPVAADDHILGPSTAKAVIIEYGDFECPACGAYEPMVEALRAQNGDKIAIIFRHYPLPQHQFAQIASQAAEAANLQGKFWEMHNLLYSEQSSWSTASSSNINNILKGYAAQLGLDTKKFMSDLTSSTVKDRIQRDVNSGNSFSIPGTPTFFLNGQELALPITQAQFQAKIDALLSN